MRRIFTSLFVLGYVVGACAQTIPQIDSIVNARAQWQHDTVNLDTFEYFVDGKPRPDLLVKQIGPAPIAGELLFQAPLPGDLQAGEHSYQVRACNSKAICSGYLIVPFTLLSDGTIIPPKSPTGGTVIQVTVSVTVKL